MKDTFQKDNPLPSHSFRSFVFLILNIKVVALEITRRSNTILVRRLVQCFVYPYGPGDIHIISPEICVWGYTYLGDTRITVAPTPENNNDSDRDHSELTKICFT